MQMVLYPHLATAGVVSTSVLSWVGNREGCCCFNTDPLLHIFSFRSTVVPQQPKSNTSMILLHFPPIQNLTEWSIMLARGEQMSAQITSFTLSYTSFPLLLCVLASTISQTFFGSLPLLFYFFFSVWLFFLLLMVPWSAFFCGPQIAKISRSCMWGRQTPSQNFYGCKDIWSFCQLMIYPYSRHISMWS